MPDELLVTRPKQSVRIALWVGIGWVVSLLMMHYPMLLSGMHRMQSDPGDSRLNNYLLEQGWLWISCHPRHEVFWNSLMLYPQPNTMAYADLMLGFGPIYWVFRLFGLQPDTAFQGWMLAGTSLNYLLAFVWLRSCAKCEWVGSMIGAVFVAANAPRMLQLEHQQLQWLLYPLLALIAIYRIFDPAAENSPDRKASLWWAVLCFAVGAQFWGAFYNGWFLVFCIGIASGAGFATQWGRAKIHWIVKRDFKAIIASGIALMIFLGPVAIQYRYAHVGNPGHSWYEISQYVATPPGWILPGPKTFEHLLVQKCIQLPVEPSEGSIGLGILTCVLAAMGLWSFRHQSDVITLGTAGLFIGVACTKFGNHSIWHLISRLPAGDAIRAPSRIALLLAIPAALGLANFTRKFRSQRPYLVAVLLLICLFEQFTILPYYDKQSARDRITPIVDALPKSAACFFYVNDEPTNLSGKLPDLMFHILSGQLDAMWASMQTGIPTLNGYSGISPPGWNLFFNSDDPSVAGMNAGSLEEKAKAWEAKWPLDPKKVVWLRRIAPDKIIAEQQP